MKKNRLKKYMLLPILLLIVLISIPAAATESDPVEPRASQFISSYSGGIAAIGSGKVRVSFSVVGTQVMDRIGASRIVVQESTNNSSWKSVKTYDYTSYSSMTVTNRSSYGSTMTYSGTAGRYYRAIITIYAAKDGGSDSRLKTTSSVKATT